jgi:hypothetical protein
MRIALLLLLGACNQVFGVDETGAFPDADVRPDRDEDGIADVMDECIAPAVDGMDDGDADGVPASTDSCPYSPSGPDIDADGVLDECDPFPLVAGDRHLCTMAFGRVEVNSALWLPRKGEQTFAVANGYMIGFDGGATPTSVIAAERIVPRTGSISMDLGWSALPDDKQTYALRVWISAGAERSASDVSCTFVNDGTNFGVGILVGEVAVGMPAVGPAANPGKAHISRVKIQPGKTGTNVLCAVGYSDASSDASEFLLATGHLDGELGEQGFSAEGGAVLLYNLITYHSPEQPPLL